MRQQNRHSSKKQSLLFSSIILALTAALTFAGVTSARYISQLKQNEIAEAANFHFSSDLLREKTSQDSATEGPVYYIDPKTTDFNVKLYNFADTTRVTSSDIKYTLSVTGGTVSSVSPSPTERILHGSAPSEAVISIIPDLEAASASGQSDPVNSGSEQRNPAQNDPVKNGCGQITVTATSSSPFSKTLKATFIPVLGNTYSIEDSPDYLAAVLTMTCTDSPKDITLILPSNVMPDETDRRVKKIVGKDNAYTFASPGKGVYSLTLLKSDSSMDLTAHDKLFASEIDLTPVK